MVRLPMIDSVIHSNLRGLLIMRILCYVYLIVIHIVITGEG
jgi:hypothetical protein